MLTRVLFMVSVLVSGWTFAAHAVVDQKASTFVLCKNQKNVRTIRITGDDQACKITYSKAGVDESVGEGRTTAACQSILQNIQNNLESSNWSCRRVGSANITWGTEATQ